MGGDQAPCSRSAALSTVRNARRAGASTVECLLNLDRTQTAVDPGAADWTWQGHDCPFLETCSERASHHWTAEGFAPVSRFTKSLIKLAPANMGRTDL